MIDGHVLVEVEVNCLVFMGKSECGEYLGIVHGILLVPHNTIMDLNKVMRRLSP